MPRYNKITFSNSQAAVADTYSINDTQADNTLYLDVLASDPSSATLYSIGTTLTSRTLVGMISVPTDLLVQYTVGATYYSDLGAAISPTATGQVAYNMKPISGQIDTLAAGNVLTDQFLYAIRMANGTVSWNTVTVDILGVAAKISIFQKSGYATEAYNWQSPPAAPTEALRDGGAITAFSASGNITTITATAAAGTHGTLTVAPTATYDSDIGKLAYSFTYTIPEQAVFDSGKGFGEKAFTDSWALTTANGTTATFSEDIYGNIHAPTLRATAGNSSITQGSSVRLLISATDHDDNAALTYAITGVPIGATLSSATDPLGVTYNPGTQTWAISTGALQDLVLAPGAQFTGQIDLTVAVTNSEVNPNNTVDVATATATAKISISDLPRIDCPPITIDSTAWHGYGITTDNATFALPLTISGANRLLLVEVSAGLPHSANNTDNPDIITSAQYAGSNLTLIQKVGAGAEEIYLFGMVAPPTGTHDVTVTTVPYADASLNIDAADYNNVAQNIPTNVLSGSSVGQYDFSLGPLHTGTGSWVAGGIFGSAGVQITSGVTARTDLPAYYDSARYLFDTNGQTLGGDVTSNFHEFTVYDLSWHGVMAELVPAWQHSSGYCFMTLDNPLGVTYGTRLNGINDHGQIVGTEYGDNTLPVGFLYDDGAYSPLRGPNASETGASGINNNGDIVGDYFDGFWHGYLANPHSASFTTIDAPAGVNGTGSQGINDGGQVVGDYANGASNLGYIYDHGDYAGFQSPFPDTKLNDINNVEQIVGDYNAATAGFIEDSTTGKFATFVFPGADQTHANGINDAGVVVGYYHNASGYHGFTFHDLQFTSFDDPNAPGNTFATGINNAGQIVGYYLDASQLNHGFLANPADGHSLI